MNHYSKILYHTGSGCGCGPQQTNSKEASAPKEESKQSSNNTSSSKNSKDIKQ